MTAWRRPERSDAALAMYAAAETDRGARPDRYRLDPDTIVERATKGGSLPSSRFAHGWREGLENYLGSAAQDGRLNALGTRMVADTAVGRLRTGARIDTYLQEHPQTTSHELTAPIVILGGWRTGTTFLFRLLGADPRLHAPLPAELTAPWRFAGVDRATREELIDSATGAHDLLHLLNPQMQAVHPSGARLPEECVLAMGTDLRNWGFTSTVRLNSYSEWLAGENLAGSYDRYRKILQLLAAGDERRFVLKAPAHTAELRHLVHSFPGAVVVQLHRDIVETIASGASLFAVFRSTYSDAVDPIDVGRFQTKQTELWLRRAVAFRSERSSAKATFIDLDYRDLVANPANAVAAVYRSAGMEPPADLDGFIAAYNRANPRAANSPHVYTPADSGLDPAELRERFSFLTV